MIQYRLVQKISQGKNIQEASVEKDYLIELMLQAIANDKFLAEHLIFRGGTALKKIYFPDFRYSEDLDFIVKEYDNLAIFENIFKKILRRITKKMPIQLNLNFFYPQKEHLQYLLDYEIFSEIKLEKNLKIDIVGEPQMPSSGRRKILFTFPDLQGKKVFLKTYDLESIAAEKIGRILDIVDEPRDLWDLHFLLNNKIKISAIKKIYKDKYAINVDPDALLDALDNSAYKNTWNIRLKNHVPNLCSYEKIVVELSDLIKQNF